MFRSGLKKIWRDVLSRKIRTMLVSASIFVGVMAVIALFTSNIVVSQQLTSDVQQDQLAMLDITVSVPREVVLDNDLYLATLNRANEAGQNLPALEGIEVVEGRAYYGLDFLNPQTGRFKTGELRAVYGDWQSIRLEPFRLIEGEFPVTGQQAVALEIRMAEAHGFKVGDSITFRGVGSGGEANYIVSGLVFHPYSASNLAGDKPGPDIGIYTTYEEAQTLLNFAGINHVVARYTTYEQAQTQFQGFVSTLDEVTPYVPVVPASIDPANNTQVQNAQVYISILSSLGLATILVSGFLVVNVITTITSEQKQQIGILKSMGVSDWEAFGIYAGIAFTYGLLGTVLAIIPGVLLSQGITAFLAPQLDLRVEGFHWSPVAILIGVVLGLVVPIVAAALPVYTASRLSIMEAITDLGISSDYGQGFIPTLIKALPLSISARQAVSNVYQKRGRLFLTGLTLTVTVGMFMGILALTVSVTDEISNVYQRITYQLTVQPNEIQDPQALQTTLENIEGVHSVSPGTIVFMELEGGYINFFTNNNAVQVFGFEPTDGIIALNYSSGTGWETDPQRAGFVISEAISTQLGLKAGDTLKFAVGGQPYEAEVIGVDENAFDFIQTRWQDLSRYANITAGAPTPNNYVVEAQLTDFSESVFAVGLDETLLGLLGVETSADQPVVVISGDLAERSGLVVGDSLTLTLDGQEATREIAAIIPNGVLGAQAAQVAPALGELPPFVVLLGFSDLAQVTGVDLSGEPIPNAYYITLTGDSHTMEAVDEVSARIQTELLSQGISASYRNQLADEDLFIRTTQGNTSIFLVASILIAIVGAIGLLTTLSISVYERQKEIGVMRSIGAGSESIALQFMLEGVLVGILAWVLGVPVGYVAALVFNKIANLDDIPFTYPPNVLVIGLVGMVVISALASLLPSLTAARKTVSEILRYQ